MPVLFSLFQLTESNLRYKWCQRWAQQDKPEKKLNFLGQRTEVRWSWGVCFASMLGCCGHSKARLKPAHLHLNRDSIVCMCVYVCACCGARQNAIGPPQLLFMATERFLPLNSWFFISLLSCFVTLLVLIIHASLLYLKGFEVFEASYTDVRPQHKCDPSEVTTWWWLWVTLWGSLLNPEPAPKSTSLWLRSHTHTPRIDLPCFLTHMHTQQWNAFSFPLTWAQMYKRCVNNETIWTPFITIYLFR